MKTLAEAHDILESWFKDGCVGNLIFFHAPKAKMVDCFVERTIKMAEMNDLQSAAMHNLSACFSGHKMEIAKNAEGEPDRIKVTRTY